MTRRLLARSAPCIHSVSPVAGFPFTFVSRRGTRDKALSLFISCNLSKLHGAPYQELGPGHHNFLLLKFLSTPSCLLPIIVFPDPDFTPDLLLNSGLGREF